MVDNTEEVEEIMERGDLIGAELVSVSEHGPASILD